MTIETPEAGLQASLHYEVTRLGFGTRNTVFYSVLFGCQVDKNPAYDG